MKGTIDLHEKWGWGVINHTDESIPDWIPLHPDDLTHFAEMKEKFDNFEARVLSSPEVEFETIIHPKFTGRIIYAKLNPKKEPKQENCCTPIGQIKRYVDCKGCDRKPKQETLEEPTMIDDWLNEYGDPEIYKKVERELELREAAEKYSLELLEAKTIQHHEKTWIKSMFIHIAEWQQERSYSEAIKFGKWLDENMQQREYYPMSAMTMEELFKQFKT
jgi:hypothetical protein